MSPAGAVVVADTADGERDAFLAEVRVADLVAGAFAAVFFVAGAVDAAGLRADFLPAAAVAVDGEADLLTADFLRVVVEMVFAAFGWAAADGRDDVVVLFSAAPVAAVFVGEAFFAAVLRVEACDGAFFLAVF